jgi:hypothetical protein
MTAKPEPANIWNVTSAAERPAYVSSEIMPASVPTNVLPSIFHSLDSRNPVIVKSGILFFISLVGFVGNGIALATLRLTPKLRTKTYTLLASLTVSDILVGLTLLWTIGYQLVVYVFSADPCSYVVLVAALAWPARVPIAITIMHVGLISIERYVAVVHPFRYEAHFTDRTIKLMIAFGWIFPGIPCAMYMTYVGRINWQTCTITASVLQSAIMDTCYISLVIAVIVVLHTCVLATALRQRSKINAAVSY